MVYENYMNDDYMRPQAPRNTDVVDMVNHPPHYKFSNGAEVIDLTEHLSFCAGNAVKYLSRAGRKDSSKAVEDLEKALWYVKREIERVKGKGNS